MPRPGKDWYGDTWNTHESRTREDEEVISEIVPYKPLNNVSPSEYWQDPHRVRLREWLTQRLQRAALDLENFVEADPEKLSGIPVIKGTRIAVAQLLAELADGQDITEIADDLGIKRDDISTILKRLSVLLDRPYLR